MIPLIDILLHVDKYIALFIDNYGILTYFILFFIILLETGLVVTPFLPGDSLLFVVGAFAALGQLNIFLLFFLLAFAAIVGDSMNYFIGNYLGKKIIQKGWIKEENIRRTEQFYDKYGAKTIVLARFVPIVRTVAPFIAGVGSMNYLRFFAYNVIGGLIWVSSFLLAGFFFGNIPAVQHNLTFVIIGIIIVSLIPAVVEYFKQRNSSI